MRRCVGFFLLVFLVFHAFLVTSLQAQTRKLEQMPLDIPPYLSGNFGELRNNHFHSGIDFKTQGTEGKTLRTVAGGHISRISVSPWGYGNVLYIDHPDGTTTVYGHMKSFSPAIAAYVKEQQYKEESFQVNLTPTPDQFPLRKGDAIGLSGNSGSSGGPHLHFEIRDTESEDIFDPIPAVKDRLKDKRPPRIQGVMIYPVEGKGVVNGRAGKRELKLVTAKGGQQAITGKTEAWGEIGLAVKAYDYMDETSNIYGVKYISLSVDSQEVFSSAIDRFGFDETRYLNSFVDYAEWKDKRSFFMKSFIDPGNRLRFLKGANRGIITISEERTYHLVYTLKDDYGNTAKLSFWIEGKEQPIPAPDTTNAEYFHWKSENRFGAKGIRLAIPPGNLYDDLYFKYAVRTDSTWLADVHTLHNKTIPIHNKAQLSLRLVTDTLANKQQYGIVRLQGKRLSWVGGTYRNGWIDADIRELGTFTITQDTQPPVITPVSPDAWVGSQTITFRITDGKSGVSAYRGEIDGQFALFEYDGKNGLVRYHFDNDRLTRGAHHLVFTLTDAAGNQSTYEKDFTW